MSQLSNIAAAMLAKYTREMIDAGFPVADIVAALKGGIEMFERVESHPGGLEAAIAEARALEEESDDLTDTELEKKLDEFFVGMGFHVLKKQCDCPKCRARRSREAEGARHQDDSGVV